jgi:hypothetical protein
MVDTLPEAKLDLLLNRIFEMQKKDEQKSEGLPDQGLAERQKD